MHKQLKGTLRKKQKILCNKPRIFYKKRKIRNKLQIDQIAFKMTLLMPQQYAGVLFLVPALKNITQGHYYSQKLMVFLGWLMPSLRISIPAPSGMGTKYNVMKKWESDPLVFTDGMMTGTIRSVVNGVEQISKFFKEFQTPFLYIAPGVQKFVDPFGPLDLFEESSSQDKRVFYAQDMWHVVAQEKDIVGVSWYCAEWLKERI